MKPLAVLGALGAAVTLTACEDYYPPPPPPAGVAVVAPPPGAVLVPAAPVYGAPAVAVAPACFYTRDIRSHTVADDHTLYINVNGRDVYRVGMSGGCLAGATSSDPIVIREPPGSSNVCRPIDLDVGISVGGMTSHCIVSSITPVSPAELAALPPRLRP